MNKIQIQFVVEDKNTVEIVSKFCTALHDFEGRDLDFPLVLRRFLDCSEEMHADEVKDQDAAKAAGKPVDWREARDTKQLGRHITACRELLKAIGDR